jgi:hypothetical protein
MPPPPPTQCCPQHTYYPVAEITAQLHSNRTDWTATQHAEWHAFLLQQCQVRDRRYAHKSLAECVEDTVSGIHIVHVLGALFAFHDNIYDAAVWAKAYIHDVVCPECGLRGHVFLMLGGLLGGVWLAVSLGVLLWLVWRQRRWGLAALFWVWIAGWVLGLVERVYVAWWG